MSDTTGIQWTDSTGNPWIGCTKVSPGCLHCYAETLDINRFSKTMGGGTKEKPVSHWGKGAPRFRTQGFWKDIIRWNKEAERTGTRRKVFPSLCDVFDDEVPIEWFSDLMAIAAITPFIDHQWLTKRPHLWRPRVEACIAAFTNKEGAKWARDWLLGSFIPSNVWIGASCEDQTRADERIPALLKIPAKIRFLSCEPLLGPIDLKSIYHMVQVAGLESSPNILRGHVSEFSVRERQCGINWVIIGGESGKGARPFNVSWAHSLVRQCKAAGIAPFMKQFGSDPWIWNEAAHQLDPIKLKDNKGGDMAEWSEDLRVREMPKL